MATVDVLELDVSYPCNRYFTKPVYHKTVQKEASNAVWLYATKNLPVNLIQRASWEVFWKGRQV